MTEPSCALSRAVRSASAARSAAIDADAASPACLTESAHSAASSDWRNPPSLLAEPCAIIRSSLSCAATIAFSCVEMASNSSDFARSCSSRSRCFESSSHRRAASAQRFWRVEEGASARRVSLRVSVRVPVMRVIVRVLVMRVIVRVLVMRVIVKEVLRVPMLASHESSPPGDHVVNSLRPATHLRSTRSRLDDLLLVCTLPGEAA